MMAAVCFILLTGTDVKEKEVKLLVNTNHILAVKPYGSKENTVSFINNNYIYEIKESPEQVKELIKKECK